MIATTRPSVDVTATILSPADGDAQAVIVRNKGAASIYLGGPTVDTATGFEVAPGETISVELAGGETLYAISGTSGQIAHVLRTSVG